MSQSACVLQEMRRPKLMPEHIRRAKDGVSTHSLSSRPTMSDVKPHEHDLTDMYWYSHSMLLELS